jgi:hypothetical protein
MLSITLVSAILSAVATFLIGYLPVKCFLPSYMILQEKDRPAMYLNNLRSYKESTLPTNFLNQPVKVHVGPLGFILIVEANVHAKTFSDNATAVVNKWYQDNFQWMEENLVKYGGILLRNFPLPNVYEYDKLIGMLHPESGGTGLYLGTALRNKLSGLKFVSTASEIGRFGTIPTHIELSFAPNPPKRVYFYAEHPNEPVGGQTTYSDFRQVWRELSEETRNRLTSRGMLIERRYQDQKKHRSLQANKSWQEMFKTENRTLVEETALAQQFTPSWQSSSDGSAHELILRHPQKVIRTHSITKEPYWATHFNVFDSETFEIPSAWSAQLFESKQSMLLAWFIKIASKILHGWLGFPYEHNMFYADTQTPIDFETTMEIRRTIARQTWIFDWQQGDLMMLDNHRMAHGRSPWWKGERRVFVAWN